MSAKSAAKSDFQGNKWPFLSLGQMSAITRSVRVSGLPWGSSALRVLLWKLLSVLFTLGDMAQKRWAAIWMGVPRALHPGEWQTESFLSLSEGQSWRWAMTVHSGISKEKNAVGVQGGGSSLRNSIAQGRLYEVCVAEWINLILKDVLFRWSKNSSLCGNLPLLLKGNPIKCWGSPYAF